MSQIKAEISLRANVKLIFHKNVGLQWYQWIPDFYNIIFWANLFNGKKLCVLKSYVIKIRESIDIIAILHFYDKSTSRWYEGWLISALIWDISGLWNRSDGQDYREKRHFKISVAVQVLWLFLENLKYNDFLISLRKKSTFTQTRDRVKNTILHLKSDFLNSCCVFFYSIRSWKNLPTWL